MRVLFISARSGGDWGMDLAFAGLVENLGPENVVDFPAHDKYRTKPVLVGQNEQDWGSERRSLGFTSSSDRLHKIEKGAIETQLQENKFDLIVVDERNESYDLYLQTKAYSLGVPVMVIAGHDSFQNHSTDTLMQMYGSRLKVCFLDNWRPEYDSLVWCKKYAWAMNFDHLWDPSERESLLQKKVYDVSFMGYNSHPDRLRFVEHIRKKWPSLKTHLVLETRPNEFSSFVKKSEYFKVMAQSKICLNLKGAAENGKAIRFWEIPYVGSYMLSQEHTGAQDMPDAPIPGVHCGFFETEDDLDLMIELMLKNEDRREKIAAAGHDFFFENHTAKARMRKMLGGLRG